MIELSVVVERTRVVVHPVHEVFARVRDVPSLAELIPAVHTCRDLGDGRWHWELGRYGALGFHVTPSFELSSTIDAPRRIAVWTDGRTTHEATGEGHLLLQANGARTRVSGRVAIDVDLPVPKVLMAPMRGVLVHELRVVLDQVLDGLGEAPG